jgi:hypothetical protein
VGTKQCFVARFPDGSHAVFESPFDNGKYTFRKCSVCQGVILAGCFNGRPFCTDCLDVEPYRGPFLWETPTTYDDVSPYSGNPGGWKPLVPLEDMSPWQENAVKELEDASWSND